MAHILGMPLFAYGDRRHYRNVTIGELEDGEAVRVTDYWGEPTTTPGQGGRPLRLNARHS